MDKKRIVCGTIRKTTGSFGFYDKENKQVVLSGEFIDLFTKIFFGKV
jgi:hypothetical protein